MSTHPRPPKPNRSLRNRSMRARDRRRGAAMILAIFLMTFLVGMLAFGIDIGHITATKAEIRRTADSAALAGCWQLYDERASGGDLGPAQQAVRGTAAQFASANRIAGASPALAVGDDADVKLGRYDWSNGSWTPGGNALADVNSVRVRVQRSSTVNGPVSLFFARIFGRAEQTLQTESTAAMAGVVRGFTLPADSSRSLGVLPFALDLETWNAMLAGQAPDDWSWDVATGQAVPGADGVLEVNLYPQGTGSPGNRGTVDIGGANNSTSDIERQIMRGVSAGDLAAFGRPFALDENGRLELNGDTGISAGVKDELASIIGQTRVIPIFESVSGSGNNAVYTIVKFAGIRVLDVKLTGSAHKKYVMVQPAMKMIRGAIATRDGGDHSDFVFAPVSLVL